MKNIILKLSYLILKIFDMDKNTRRVICYHSIARDNKKYSISIDQFKKQITDLKKWYSFVSLQEILSPSKKNIPLISLTIDDGYKNAIQIVEFTKKYNIPVTLFVLANNQRVNRNELDNTKSLLAINEIKYLHSKGWTIGNHSSTHANFNHISDKEIEEEVVHSKKTLEKKLGFKIDYFAYPKGVYSQKIIDVVKKSGYKAAFAANPGIININSNFYAIPRFIMEKNNTFTIPVSFSLSTQILRSFFTFIYEK